MSVIHMMPMIRMIRIQRLRYMIHLLLFVVGNEVVIDIYIYTEIINVYQNKYVYMSRRPMVKKSFPAIQVMKGSLKIL